MRHALPAAIRRCTRLSRPVLHEIELRDHLFPHHEFLDLTGDRHWKFVGEANVLRHFEMRDLVAAELDDLLDGAGFAGLAT